MDQLVDKIASLKKIIKKLRAEFGAEAFAIFDHWEGDTASVGIARREAPEVLVYISTHKQRAGLCFVSLELPSSDPDMPYKDAGEFEHVDFEKLKSIVGRHLNLSS